MSLKRETPCDFGPCPYEAEHNYECECWCGAEEPQDEPDAWFYDDDPSSADEVLGWDE